jgi:hypothetical protein
LIVSGVSHILQFSFLRFQIVLLLRSSRSPCSLLMTKIRMNCQKIVFLFLMHRFCLSSAPTAFSSFLLHLIREDLFTFHYERLLIGDYYKKFHTPALSLRWVRSPASGLR